MNDKKTLRKEFIKRRNKMAQEQVALASDAIFLYVKEYTKKIDFKTVFCYESYKNEVQTRSMMDHFFKEGKDVYIPVVTGAEMHLAKWTPEMLYTINKYGIKEPQNPIFYTGPIDVAIVPGLAFAENGARLGYGGGYYDRWFSANADVYKIGLCYAWQFVPILPEEEFDIRMDTVICEIMKDS